MRILIIDSNSSYETIYRRKLLFLTTKVDFATDINLAVKYVSTRKYDIIFVSHVLKGFSGETVIKEIKEKASQTPIAVLASGNHIEEISRQYSPHKICGIVNKGQNNEDFSTKIKDMLSTTTLKKLAQGMTNVPSRD